VIVPIMNFAVELLAEMTFYFGYVNSKFSLPPSCQKNWYVGPLENGVETCMLGFICAVFLILVKRVECLLSALGVK